MPPAPRPIADRFWPKVEKTDACWLWKGAKTPFGHGRFNVDRRARPAHRVAYELVVGPIPAGLEIDHLCRTPSCVNPAHLEPVTSAENTRRGMNRSAVTKRTGVCQRGHVLFEVGVRVYRNGSRGCRECIRQGFRAWTKRKREEACRG